MYIILEHLPYMNFQSIQWCYLITYRFHYMNEKEDQLILNYNFFINFNHMTSVKWGSEITPCNKINKPVVVYRFTGNVITSITTLRTK